jgi:hypothetical protein
LRTNVVAVTERNCPKGQEPIAWYLVTNEPIDTIEQVAAIVDAYRARWVVEISHSSCTSCHRSLNVLNRDDGRARDLEEAA